MKEYEENDTKDDFDFNNRNEYDDNSSSNDLIPSLKQRENNYNKSNTMYQNKGNRMHKSQNEYQNYNTLKNNKKKLSFFDYFPEQENDDLYGLNDDSYFFRYYLNDEQKEYLMPRNSTLISKILDFFFNW